MNNFRRRYLFESLWELLVHKDSTDNMGGERKLDHNPDEGTIVIKKNNCSSINLNSEYTYELISQIKISCWDFSEILKTFSGKKSANKYNCHVCLYAFASNISCKMFWKKLDSKWLFKKSSLSRCSNSHLSSDMV